VNTMYTHPADVVLGPVRLMQFLPRHREAFTRMRLDDNVTQFMTSGVSPSRETFNSRFEYEVLNPSLHLLIETVKEGYFVGECGLSREQGNFFEVFCALDLPWQRKGIGRIVVQYLCDWVKHDGYTPMGFVDPKNTASLGLLQALGFTQVANTSANRNHASSLAYALV
jgi:RimJ/RimL family protein N-acetyltransferase